MACGKFAMRSSTSPAIPAMNTARPSARATSATWKGSTPPAAMISRGAAPVTSADAVPRRSLVVIALVIALSRQDKRTVTGGAQEIDQHADRRNAGIGFDDRGDA